MNLRILWALLRKEALILQRNPFIPKIVVIMPLMVMLVIPLVANLDVRNVAVAVVDNDHSPLSRRIVSDLDATDAIQVKEVCPTHVKAMSLIERGDVDVLLSIPADFSQEIQPVGIEANGVNATKGMLGAQYVAGSVMLTVRQWMEENGIAATGDTLSIINRYNPTLDFRNYMIPALMVVLLIIMCGFLPTLNLVSEKESGTLEALNVTPVGRFTFVLSKLIPFWVVGLAVVTIGMLVGWLVYGLKPAGSIAAIYLAAVLFCLFISGLGVIIANSSATMLQSIFVMFAFIMIFQLMGGLFTPISSMPQWAQWLTYLVPPRYINEIMRSVYLKGATIGELLPQYACLAAYAALTCSLAAITYRKQS